MSLRVGHVNVTCFSVTDKLVSQTPGPGHAETRNHESPSSCFLFFSSSLLPVPFSLSILFRATLYAVSWKTEGRYSATAFPSETNRFFFPLSRALLGAPFPFFLTRGALHILRNWLRNKNRRAFFPRTLPLGRCETIAYDEEKLRVNFFRGVRHRGRGVFGNSFSGHN